MNFDPSPLFWTMCKLYEQHFVLVPKGERQRLTICNEGSTRSGKTWDFFHFLVAICDQNRQKNLEIYIYRDTLTNCRDYTLKEFVKCLKVIGIYEDDALTGYGQKPQYDLFGNKVYFRGLDSGIEAQPSDICFFNESLEMDEEPVQNVLMRCRQMAVFDWNPKYTAHWCFEMEGRPNTFFTLTTYKNNKHLEQTIINDIESWCPWEFEDLEKPEPQRRPNLKNIQSGTVNRFRWLVYGQGVRCAMEGLVFPDVTYISELPKDVEKYWYGLDYANTVGTYAFSECCNKGRNLYFDCPIYVKNLNSLEDFYTIFKKHYETKKNERPGQWVVICDSAKPQNKVDLNGWASRDGLNVVFLDCKKFAGCVTWRIDLIKRYSIHLVNRDHIRKEQENYFYQKVNGIELNEPLKNGFDHFWDAAGMSIQYEQELR